MFKKISLTITFLFLIILAFAQTTIIKGTVENSDFHKIRIITYTDQVSYFEKTIASAEIDDNGNFYLELDLPETIYSFLAVGFQKAEFYIEARKT